MITILTLHLDDSSQAFCEALRQEHFPPARNLIPAHLTLFHHLEGLAVIGPILRHTAASVNSFALSVSGLRSLGKGVAFVVSSPELLALHGGLSHEFASQLTPQDRQKFKPHIVIQNKVPAPEAKTLLMHMQQGFQPRTARATGLDLWEYLGGPWQHLETCWFREAD